MTAPTSSSSFFSLLQNRWHNTNTLLCVGLDVDIKKMPQNFQDDARSLTERIFAFNKAIIDATHEYVCCYKPQSAFYEQYGVDGLNSLADTINYIHKVYPEVPVLLDAKRGDVGNTADAYAKALFDVLHADAITLNPYLGYDSIEPFIKYTDKGVIILAKTSNPGSGDFQNKTIEGIPLYEYIARTVTKEWNKNNNCGLVVGATYPNELKNVRKIVGDMLLLIPGIGAQGGDIEACVKAGKDSNGTGMIISSSRAILYASSYDDFSDAARDMAKKTRDKINTYR